MPQQIVYWANLSQEPDEIMAPKSLIADIAKAQGEHKGGNHVACPAIRNKHKNTFVTHIPYDFYVNFFEDRAEASHSVFSLRQGLYENSYAFDWQLQRIFFSAEPQIMEVSPAFLHRTSFSQYGHAPSGAFDISQWFRPSFPTFQLWSGEKHFSALAGEAHLYFNFPNDNKVVLLQFAMSEILYQIMGSCLTYKNIKPKQTMETMYEDFVNSGLSKKTLVEIKNNLILG